MKDGVHRLEVHRDTMQNTLEQFLNSSDGEIPAVVPNVRPAFQRVGATLKVDVLLVVVTPRARIHAEDIQISYSLFAEKDRLSPV